MHDKKVGIRRIIGKTQSGTLIGLDYAFAFDSGHVGVTGDEIAPVPKEVYDYFTTPEQIEERLEDLWHGEVSYGATDKGLEEWAAEYYEFHGDDAIFDQSISYDYERQIREELGYSEEEYPVLESNSCGRILKPLSEMPEIVETYDTELWLEVYRFEKLYQEVG